MNIDPALFEENDRTAPAADDRRYLDVGELHTESGGYLPSVVVAYETWGELNEAKDNAILACHALSGDSHAIGWWDRLIGPGKPIDTDRFFVIGTNCLGGCQGTTGPSSPHPEGGHWGSRFPVITVGDMVEVQMRLIASLGINKLLCVAGGSMGGMQALEWTRRGKVQKAFITASCAAHNAMQIGFNETARQAIMRDPKWRCGDYPLDDQPVGGLSVARMLGHISFLSEAAFEAKFGRRFQDSDAPRHTLAVDFQVESYLNYQGLKFTKRFDANSLLVLSKAIDYYECQSLQGSSSEYLFVSYASDWLYPSYQSEALHRLALDANCTSRWLDIDLPYGHDAFLLDGDLQGGALRQFLNGPAPNYR